MKGNNQMGFEQKYRHKKITDDELIAESKILTATEIADKYGMHRSGVWARLNRLGLKPVATRNPKKDHTEYINKITSGKFSFVDYLGNKKYIVRCNECGTKQERSIDSRINNQHCKHCTELRKAREKLLYQLKLALEIQKPKTCQWCGSIFYSVYKNKKYCSDRCARKRKNKRADKELKSRVKDSSLYIDSDITLERLYKRDNGLCWICGRKTNWNDWKTAQTGNKYPGSAYPVRDHVIPLARGGEHSWENVRLACWECNNKKADTLYPFDPVPIEVLRSERAKRNKKKTAQYTLDGNLVKIYESTAEVEKDLGIPCRTIQNACRGQYKGNKAHGYRWEYVG